MKVFAFVLAVFSAATDAAKSERVTGSRLPADSKASRKIMEHAVRVNRQGERILQENKFELSSLYSFQFDTCVSLRAEPNENADFIFDTDLEQYASKGAIVPQKSYILFNVCLTKYCDYYKADDNLFMIDVNTYMAAIGDYFAARHEEYCSACVDSTDYCKYVEYQKTLNQNYNEYAGVDGFYSSSYNNGGGRDLSRYNFEVIDCAVCTKMNCFTESYSSYQYAENGQNNEESYISTVASWVEEITQCKDTEVVFLENYHVYAGFMCNEDGSGVDIATFLDEDCMIYNSHTAFKTVATDDDKTMMYAASEMITYPFLHQINCNGDYAYLSMDEYRQQAQNYHSYNNNNNDAEASEYCKTLFEGGEYGKAVSLRDCNQDGEEDEQPEEEQDGVEVDEYVDEDYSWFSYVLSWEDSQDTEATCNVIRKMQGEYETVYRWSGSGQIYNYGTGPTNKYSFSAESVKKWFSQNEYDKMDTSLIVAISIATAIALTAFGCILYSCCSPNSLANKYQEQKRLEEHMAELDAKREHLVNPNTGKLM